MASTVTKVIFSPTRIFFRVSEEIPSIAHARTIFKTLGQYGEMVEYKFMRCPETHKYLQHGFIVYKNSENAQTVLSEKFIKVPSDMFSKSCEIKLEKASKRSYAPTQKTNASNSESA